MLGYSPMSAIDRQIEACPQYDKFFDIPKLGKLKKKIVDGDGGVEETVQQMLNIVNQNWREVDKAKHLVKGSNTYETAKNIFDWLFRYIKYNLEKGEVLNTPSASYYWGQVKARENVTNTKQYPVDCDDFTIFACSFLKSLNLPWGLRIASYDGVKFGHVYCIVPLQNGKEIIIDPVYYDFNKEKPYRMQKTFYGNKSQNLKGMQVYYQGVKGLSGFAAIESDTKRTITALAGGEHFSGYGLGSIEDDQAAMSDYLKDTLKVSKRRPDMVRRMYKDPQQFCQMLDTAINGLNTEDEADIMSILAEQERNLLKKTISGFEAADWYRDLDPNEQELSGVEYAYENGERYMNLQGLGFFGTLGLFNKLKDKIANKRIEKATKKGDFAKAEKIQAKVEKRDIREAEFKQKVKDVGQKIVQVINKVNPITVTARNALRILVALNFMGMATRLKEDKEAHDKIRDLFKNMGGNPEKISKSIEKGASRNPHMEKTGNVEIPDDEAIEGFGQFGVVAEVGGLLGIAGKIVEQIFTWFKKKKEEKQLKKAEEEGLTINPLNQITTIAPAKLSILDKIKARVNELKEKQGMKTIINPNPPANSPNTYNTEDGGSNDLPVTEELQQETGIYKAENGGRNQSSTQQNTGDMKEKIIENIKKYKYWIGGIGVLGGIAYYMYNKKPKTQTLSGIRKRRKKLSGIKLK